MFYSGTYTTITVFRWQAMQITVTKKQAKKNGEKKVLGGKRVKEESSEKVVMERRRGC